MSKIHLKVLICFITWAGSLLLMGLGPHEIPQYRAQTILSGEWGAKPGKFGLAIPDQGEIIGPRTFTIGPDKTIYVFDSIKRNVKAFSSEGVFKGSIGKNLPGYSFAVFGNSFYFLDGEAIREYSLSGVPGAEHPVASGIDLHEGYGQWMQMVEGGRLYVKSKGTSYRVWEDVAVPETVLSDQAQMESARRGSPNSSGTHWFFLTRENGKRFYLRMFDKSGNPAGEFPVETADTFGSVLFLDTDRNGVIYLEAKRIGADGIARLEVRRYGADGQLIQIIELPNKYYSTVYKKIIVAPDGALFQLQTLPSGVKVVKWSPFR